MENQEEQPVGAESIEFSLAPENPAVEEAALPSTQNTSSRMMAVCRCVWCFLGFLILFGCVAAGFYVMNLKLEQVASTVNTTKEDRWRLNDILTQHDDLMKKHQALKPSKQSFQLARLIQEQQQMNTSLKGLQPKQNELQVQYDALKTKLSSLQSTSMNVEPQVNTLQRQIEENVKSCNKRATDLQTMNKTLATLKQQQQKLSDLQHRAQGLARGIACNNDMAYRFSCSKKN
uniref:uncharacterized protein LOC131127801 n=1 Tax=Doryrhamphus excisus TaxID=161450 RepID=UPI0025ADED07|nr:uncharacterized protein LOC131127801 [Doryrhamphus excisus]XP_057926025.1 uncharacterized protein LOC131127801 [Doryrhamphus excisus]XP_057926026.1 uncharacterized protein LOC131127801 [Doryrhamphus excisus]